MKTIMLVALSFVLVACSGSSPLNTEGVGAGGNDTSSSSSNTSSGVGGSSSDGGTDAPVNDPGKVITIDCVNAVPCPLNETADAYPNCWVGVQAFPGESKYEIEATVWVINPDDSLSMLGKGGTISNMANAAVEDGKITVACAQTCAGLHSPCSLIANTETVKLFVRP